MSDEIRRLSEELARDPSSMVFLELGEQLRRRRELDVALHIALRGLERHAHHPEAHDLLARICVDRGELQRAFDEWDMVLRLAPSHVGARKGIGYVLYKQGKVDEAERHLEAAAAVDEADPTIARALGMVRQSLGRDGNGAAADIDGGRPAGERTNGAGAPLAPKPGSSDRQRGIADARMLFTEVLGQGDHTALLVDADGLVMAGVYVTSDADDVSHEIGAALSAIREEAERATTHVMLGAWEAVLMETEAATIALAPAPEGATVMLAAVETIPLGSVRRTLERCRVRAVQWLREGA